MLYLVDCSTQPSNHNILESLNSFSVRHLATAPTAEACWQFCNAMDGRSVAALISTLQLSQITITHPNVNAVVIGALRVPEMKLIVPSIFFCTPGATVW